MKTFEILAPVGAGEQLKAAVRCGANAVYLGTSNFNARRNADNFPALDLKEAVSYCHLRNVKVYVTLNTLVFDRETEDLADTIRSVVESGADAVIVQDFATVKLVRDICPDFPLHASTQMAVHNVSGAKFLESEGFSRIVLARELSLEEIKEIRNSVSAELEVFVHGAHCMSASGNCYLSAMLGERSGNRGLCAQGCRLNWKSRHGREYALSLKDMSYLDSISELMAIGIDSFKIEGRMKRPEYVACAVSSLKSCINNLPYDKETLRSVFSRSGFTDGYLKGQRTISMFGYRKKEDVTSSSGVLKNLEALYKDDIRPLSADGVLTLKSGSPAIFELKAEGEVVSVYGDIPETPRVAPLSQDIARRNASKLGDTPFTLNSFTFINEDSLTLSASSINALRRNAVSLLQEKLTKPLHTVQEREHVIHPIHNRDEGQNFRVRLSDVSQYSEELSDAQYIILPIDEILKNKDFLKEIAPPVIAELPHLIYPFSEDKIREKLEELKKTGINRALAGNVGAINILKEKGFIVHGSHGLNVTNTFSLNFFESSNLEDIVLSFELNEKDIRNLGGTLKRGVYVYGYLPIMLMRACPQKSENGCEKCTGKTFLTDRKGINFHLICHNKEYTVLHNSVPLYLGNKAVPNVDFSLLYFTSETKSECGEIYRLTKEKADIPYKKTNGLFTRELL